VTNITYRTASGETVRSFAYAYDLSGMITQKVDMAGITCVTTMYTYDGLNRLLSETIMQSGTNTLRQFTYDLAGNRLSQAVNCVTNTYSYGSGNRLNAVSEGISYTHDNAGHVSCIVRNGSTLDLVWNLQGQLVSVSTNGVLAESYTYDPLGRRLSTMTGDATVYHAYNGVQCIADLDASGNLLRSYTWGQGIDNLLAMTVYSSSAANTYYAIKDHLGSVQAMVNSQGQIVESYRYDAFGSTTILSSDSRPLTASAIGNRYMFQGREYFTAHNLYNYRARWYDPKTGRWLSNDPIGISGGLNLYAFCGNNAVNFRDPRGRSYIDINFGGGWWLGITFGVLINGSGFYPYFGGGAVTPGAGASLTWSPSNPSHGWSVGLQGQAVIAGQVGYGFDECGGWFWELGAGWPPGASLTGYYIWGPFFGTKQPNPNPPQPDPGGPPYPPPPDLGFDDHEHRFPGAPTYPPPPSLY